MSGNLIRPKRQAVRHPSAEKTAYLTQESDGDIVLQYGDTTVLTVNKTTGLAPTIAAQSGTWVSGSLTAGSATTGGATLSLANPTGATIFLTRLILDITTVSTGAATVDAGIAANGTTSNDTLIDGLDVNAATGTFDNIENQGTNGVSTKKWTSSQFLTITPSADTTGLVGTYRYHYIS